MMPQHEICWKVWSDSPTKFKQEFFLFAFKFLNASTPSFYYESLTASRDEKRATLSPLLQALTVPYWGCFNDRICPSYPLLQLSPCTLPRGFTGRASTTSLKLVRFGHYLGMRWQAFGALDNNKDCTKLHCSSYMIYSLSFREGELNGERHV